MNLRLHIRHIECLFVGFFGIYTVFRSANVAPIEVTFGIIRIVASAKLPSNRRLFVSRNLRIYLKWVASPLRIIPLFAVPALLVIGTCYLITTPTLRPFGVIPLQSIGHSISRSAMNNNFTRTSFQLRKLQTSDFCRPSNSENIAVFVYFGCLSTTIIDVIFMISSTRSKSKNN